MRDAATEAAFFTHLRQHVLAASSPTSTRRRERRRARIAEPRELPFVQEALASIAQGGYAEALARVGVPARAQGRAAAAVAAASCSRNCARLRGLAARACRRDEWRRIRGEQEIIVRYEPEQALATLPALLREPADRERLLTLLDKLLADERVQGTTPTDASSSAMLERIRDGAGARRSRAARAEAAARRASRAPKRAPCHVATTGSARMEPQAREVPAPDRLLQDAAADADGRRASLRREFAAKARSRRRGSA